MLFFFVRRVQIAHSAGYCYFGWDMERDGGS